MTARYKQLRPEDRVTLAALHQKGFSRRQIAAVLGRSPATVSIEVRRNSSDVGLFVERRTAFEHSAARCISACFSAGSWQAAVAAGDAHVGVVVVAAANRADTAQHVAREP